MVRARGERQRLVRGRELSDGSTLLLQIQKCTVDRDKQPIIASAAHRG